uniref:Core Histone H2A/H2B/H3 domain-containing protein n=1 Tax=Sphenodon punctatus TaxID=8508 RepID=A0A8D0L2J2_SPHPU
MQASPSTRTIGKWWLFMAKVKMKAWKSVGKRTPRGQRVPKAGCKSPPAPDWVKKSRHAAPRDSRLQQIHRLQRSAEISLHEMPFLKLTKKVACNFEKNLRFQSPAVLALKEVCQAYLLGLFEDWNLCALHANRATIIASDVHLARCLRGERI